MHKRARINAPFLRTAELACAGLAFIGLPKQRWVTLRRALLRPLPVPGTESTVTVSTTL